MYLSRLVLNPRHRQVWRNLGDCQGLHRTVMSAFPSGPGTGDARSALGVLYRVEEQRSGAVTLLVQSKVPPDWSALEVGYLQGMGEDTDNPACKAVDQQYRALHAGDVLTFRLRANPTRKIDTKTGIDGRRRNGKRVELCREEAQLEWLRRKGEQAGFELLSVRANPHVPNVRAVPGTKVTGKRPGNGAGALTLASVLYEGILRVTDGEKFRRALEQGIGPGKAYGFGLLSVARATG